MVTNKSFDKTKIEILPKNQNFNKKQKHYGQKSKF